MPKPFAWGCEHQKNAATNLAFLFSFEYTIVEPVCMRFQSSFDLTKFFVSLKGQPTTVAALPKHEKCLLQQR